MPELKLGTKYECYNCGTKFYDLGKGAALCPKCGADQKDSGQAESPAASQASRRRRKAEITKALDIEEEEPIAPDISEDELVEPEIEGGAELVEEEEEEEADED